MTETPDLAASLGADVGAQLVSYINQELSKIDEAVEVETDLLMTGALDSLAVVQLTVWMEDEFGIDVDPLDVTLDNFQTIEQMVAYVATKRATTES